MNFKRLPIAVLALALAVPAVSMARDHEDWHHDRPDWDHPGYRHDYYRGVGPHHEWQRGGRLPNEYRGGRYVVNDWRGHHLSAPPRGYRWVQVNGDYVLAAVATGIILDTLLSN